MGITDYDAQTAELKSRWARLQKAKKSTSAPAANAGLVRLPAKLDDAQATSCGLQFVTTEVSPTTGGVQFVYMKSGGAAAAAKPTAGQKRGLATKAAVRRVPAVAAMPDDDEASDDDDDDDDDDMSWACDVTVMRLCKKAKKENLMALCADFGVPVSGNKETLAHNLAEQLHYETDDEEDDE